MDEERVENLEKKVTAHRQASESVKDIPMKWNYRISGKIHDPSGSPIENIPINAFDKNTLLTPDDFLGSSITDTLGRFEITFSRKDFAKPVQLMEGEPDIYLTITDPNKQFSSVYDSLGVYNKGVDNEGNVVWKERVINDVTNIDKYDITVHFIDTTTSDKYGVPQMDAK